MNANRGRSDIGTGASKLNEFLFNYASKVHDTRTILGFFDYDEEGITQFNGLIKSGLFRLLTDTDSVKVAQHIRNTNIKALLLPIPPHRIGFSDRREPNYCHFSMELYFEDSVFEVNQKFYPYKNDTSVFRFHGNKGKFFNHVNSKRNSINFGHFRILFDEINKTLANN
jgi:hypothetical protein